MGEQILCQKGIRTVIKVRIKFTELTEYRQALLKIQNFICPLCNRVIEPKQATLDHSHKDGHVRAVLHRNCNGVLGRIEHWSGKIKMCSRKEFLIAVIEYLDKDYSNQPYHPKHKG